MNFAHNVKNWSGTDDIAGENQIVRPKNVEEIIQCIGNNTKPLRLCGSRYSSPALLRCPIDTQLIDMSGVSGLRSINSKTATFGGGTLLKDVYAILLAYDAILPCSPGVIGEQTLAGALATGTHGQGLGQSALSDAVQSFEVVTMDKRVLNVQAGEPYFDAFLLSLGVLGIITNVELRHITNRIFSCAKSVIHFNEFCDGYMQWNEEATFVKAWWFPETQQVHLWRVTPSQRTHASLKDESPRTFGNVLLADSALNDTVARSRQRMLADTGMPIDTRPLYQTVERFANFQDVTGNVYDILCKGIPAAQINVEIGIPFAQSISALKAIACAIREQKISLHYPIILRAVGPSSAWLSPAHDGATCYFGMVVYTDDDGRTDPTALKATRTLEHLLAGIGGRPHWGKFFDPCLYDMRLLYPRIAEFNTLRSSLDPLRRLTNAFVDTLLT